MTCERKIVFALLGIFFEILSDHLCGVYGLICSFVFAGKKLFIGNSMSF